jgi:2,3-bisphosphoglycerate-dependent phosphoglycerate mutase
LENKFTGWTDVELSSNGIKEAHEAGKLLKSMNFHFDIAYTSVLKRAIDTLQIIMDEMNLDVKVIENYKLNERHYGALQGLNKDETIKKYGQEQVKLWRRSKDVRPPLLSVDDKRNPKFDKKYIGISDLPLGENLEDTIKRVKEYYEDVIKKDLINNKDVIVVAHGNSLRGLIAYLENLNDEEIINLEIPTGKPICYIFDDNLKIIKKDYVENMKFKVK